MASPSFSRTIAAATYKGNPYLLAQARFDYFNWGSRTTVFDGTTSPTVGKEVALEGKDESGGANATGWTMQLRLICPAAGRPYHPLQLQVITKSAGTQSVP